MNLSVCVCIFLCVCMFVCVEVSSNFTIGMLEICVFLSTQIRFDCKIPLDFKDVFLSVTILRLF